MKNWIYSIIISMISANAVFSQITISEVMFNPSGSETSDEFIEVFNTSSSDISLEGWLLVIDSDTLAIDIPPDSAISQENYTLRSADFAIIHDSPYWTSSLIYESRIPSGTIRFSSTYSLTNSTAKKIQILDSTKAVINSYTYSPVNDNGYSDEKILLAEPNVSTNWLDSDWEHGTPGSKNSVSPLENDLGIYNLPRWIPEKARPNESLQIQIPVQNSGTKLSGSAEVNLALDLNQDSLISAEEILETKSFTDVAPSDSIMVEFVSTFSTGSYDLIAEVFYAADEDNLNNKYHWVIHVGYPEMSLLINEIMYDPYDGDPEWIEIYNPGIESINMSNWVFGDASSTHTVLPAHEIPPEGMVVITTNTQLGPYDFVTDSVIAVSPFPTLNNSSDGLYLRDMSGFTVDSVKYYSSWGGVDGVSLERINPNIQGILNYNWSESENENGATPSKMNSVIAPHFDAALTQCNSKIDNYSDILMDVTVKNLGQNSLAGGILTIYHDSNEDRLFEASEVMKQFTNISIPIADSVTYEITLPTLPGGQHQIFAEIRYPEDINFNNDLGIETIHQIYPFHSIVVSEIMYRPESGEPEWIEFCVLHDSVDIRGFSVHDAGHSCEIVFNERTIFYAGDYFIIAQDSSILQTYLHLDVPLITVADLPAFNNGSDSIGIMNFDGSIIDNLYYSSEWGGDYGISLERKNIYHLSTIGQNWGSSIAEIGATPGTANSLSDNIKTKLQVIRADSNYTGLKNETIHLNFTIYNSSEDTLINILCKYGFDVNLNGRLESEEHIDSAELPELISGSESTLFITTTAPNNAGPNVFLITFTNEAIDEFYETEIWVPYSFQSILFNEIYPDPSQIIPAEFIEFVNITEERINLSNWKILVNSRSMQIHDNAEINPHQYFVTASDSISENPGIVAIPVNWQSLPNSGASIILQDQYGYAVDSLTYSQQWGLESGRSLERLHIQPNENTLLNWQASHAVKGATPGSENSLYISQEPQQESWSLSTKVFSPDGDGINDILKIAYSGPEALKFVTIKIFNTEGKLLKTLAQDEIAPTPALWTWDGFRDDMRAARIGMYILLIQYEGIADIKGNLRKVVVLAKPL